MKMAVLILAAGAASRFGATKQLAMFNGRSLLQHCIDTANSFLPGAVYTVLGSNSGEIGSKITRTGVIFNSQWRRGLGSSIAVGTRYLKDDFDAILIMLADQPQIRCHHLEHLLAIYKGQQVACCHYRGDVGVPAIFGSSYFNVLMNLSSDKGGKQLLKSINPSPNALSLGRVADDIDYHEQLALLIQEQYGSI